MNHEQFQMFMEATKSNQEQITHILELLSLNKTDLATKRSLNNIKTNLYKQKKQLPY